jgi:hypothetical protein
VDNIKRTVKTLSKRGQKNVQVNEIELMPYGDISIFSLRSPDGAIVEFYSK